LFLSKKLSLSSSIVFLQELLTEQNSLLQMSLAIQNLALRYSVSPDAVQIIANSLRQTGGTAAHFNHPDLGGMGTWMPNGMTMIGNMFDQNLKEKVNQLCTEIASTISQQDTSSANQITWPAHFGQPSCSGQSNNLRYAFFPQVRRLAIDCNGQRKIYDTLDHNISSISSASANSGNRNMQILQLLSQYGSVDLNNLPVVESS